MTTMTPELEIALNEDRLMSLMRMLGDLRRQVEDLKDSAEFSGQLDSAETRKTLREFNSVVLACNIAERTLDDCRNKQAGIARGGYALDLERARAEIGCRLNRIRKCGIPREVSG